jgi:hypothetical protein
METAVDFCEAYASSPEPTRMLLYLTPRPIRIDQEQGLTSDPLPTLTACLQVLALDVAVHAPPEDDRQRNVV